MMDSYPLTPLYSFHPFQFLYLSDGNNIYGNSEAVAVLPSFLVTVLKILFYVRHIRGITQLIQDMEENVKHQSDQHEESARTFRAAEKHLSTLTLLFFATVWSSLLFKGVFPFLVSLFKILTH